MAEKNSERTAAAWTQECLGLLQAVHPDYRLNRQVSGRFIEFVRPHSSGLLISQNFLRIRDMYYLCVALLFSERAAAIRLYCPLFAGSRFDHNRTVWRQFLDDFGLKRGDSGYPGGVWSSGVWRTKTLEHVARGLVLNEEHLVPRYLEVLRGGKERLVRLFKAAKRIYPDIDPDMPISAQAGRFGVNADELQDFPLRAARLEAATIARGGRCYVGYGDLTGTVDLDALMPELMALYFADVFLPELDRLGQIVSIAENL